LNASLRSSLCVDPSSPVYAMFTNTHGPRYYTLAVGTPSPNVTVDQKKLCAVAHSKDGVVWYNHSIVMGPNRDNTRENVACAAPVVWRDGEGVYRMVCVALRPPCIPPTYPAHLPIFKQRRDCEQCIL
jgi:hypothetical protein